MFPSESIFFCCNIYILKKIYIRRTETKNCKPINNTDSIACGHVSKKMLFYYYYLFLVDLSENDDREIYCIEFKMRQQQNKKK